jgi:cytochrome c nitrite reductase small subunit
MKIVVAIGVITLVAVAAVGMYATNFTAYLGNDPATCNNCHVMDAVYENWYHAGHGKVAVCVDCHTPHAFIPKYFVKAMSGFRHVSIFSFGKIPVAFRALESTDNIVQENCIRCHSETVSAILDNPMPMDRYCFDCHRDASHGERGITIHPYEEIKE